MNNRMHRACAAEAGLAAEAPGHQSLRSPKARERFPRAPSLGFNRFRADSGAQGLGGCAGTRPLPEGGAPYVAYVARAVQLRKVPCAVYGALYSAALCQRGGAPYVSYVARTVPERCTCGAVVLLSIYVNLMVPLMRGWARLLLDRARDLIIHGSAHRGANGVTMPTDEDDQDGHFFYNHPERGAYPAA